MDLIIHECFPPASAQAAASGLSIVVVSVDDLHFWGCADPGKPVPIFDCVVFRIRELLRFHVRDQQRDRELGYTFGMIASTIMLLTFSFISIENRLLSAGVSQETINSIADTIKYSYLMENFNTTIDAAKTIPDTLKEILSQSMGKTFLIIGIAQLITAVIVWFGLKSKGISFRGAVQQLKPPRKGKPKKSKQALFDFLLRSMTISIPSYFYSPEKNLFDLNQKN